MSRIVVVGASMAGLRTAEQLRSAGWSGEIVLVGDETHLPYNRPPLSKEALAQGGSVPELLKTLEFRRRPSIDDAQWMLGRRVVSVQCSTPSTYTVTLDDGTAVETDGIVVATGVTPRRLPFTTPVPAAKAGRHVVRTVDDAAALHDELVPGARIVIVGGGLIGCEVAATATQLGCHATVIVGTSGRDTSTSSGSPRADSPNSALSGTTGATGPADSASASVPSGSSPSAPMRRVLGDKLGPAVGDFLRERGVEFATDRVTALDSDASGRVCGVTLEGDTTLPADMVVEAIGAAPALGWLSSIGMDLSDGVLTNASLAAISSTGEMIPGIVAVGDAARFPAWRGLGPARRVEHWQTAIDTAKIAARTLVAQLNAAETAAAASGSVLASVTAPATPTTNATEPVPLPSFWSDVFGMRIQGYGVTGPELDGTRLETVLLEGSLDELDAGAALGYLYRGEPVGVVTVGLPSSRQLSYRKIILDGVPFAALV